MLEINKNDNGLINKSRPIKCDYTYLDKDNISKLRKELEELINSDDWDDRYTDDVFKILSTLTGVDISDGDTLDSVLDDIEKSFSQLDKINKDSPEVEVFNDTVEDLSYGDILDDVHLNEFEDEENGANS